MLLSPLFLLHYLPHECRSDQTLADSWLLAGACGGQQSALCVVAKNVHDIDLKENKFGRTEVAGLRGALGLSAAAAMAMFRFKVVMFQPWRRLSRRGWQDQAHRGDGRERYA